MVNFSDKLSANRVSEWRDYYVDYVALKKVVRDIERKLRYSNPEKLEFSKRNNYGSIDWELDRELDEPNPDESFFNALQVEATKVEDFYQSKIKDLRQRLTHARDSVRRLREKYPGTPMHQAQNHGESAVEISPASHKQAFSLSRGEPGSPKVTPQKRRVSVLSLRAQDHSESDEDENEEAGDLVKKDLHATTSLKRNFVDIHRQMNYLLNYSTMNYTAFIKIIKKHDKVTHLSSKKRAMSIITECSFVDTEEINNLILELETLFAAVYHNGNLRIARGDLLTKTRPLDSFEMIHLGFRFGVVATLLVWVCWVLAIDALIRSDTTQFSAPFFIVYRGLSTMILAMWIWAVCLHVWESSRVNYIFLFEFSPRDVTTPFSIARKASSLTMLLLVNILFYIKIQRNEIVKIPQEFAPFFPFSLFLFLILYSIFTRCGGPAGLALAKIVLTPLGEVTFYQSFVADVLTSLVRPLVDFAFSFCFFFSGEWKQDQALYAKDASQSSCMNSWFYQSIVVPFVIAFPLYVRFGQCIRRYYDTGKRIPNLLNAAKYVFAFSVVLLGAIHSNNIQDQQTFHSIWYFCAFVSSLITFAWDVIMDWGLLKNCHQLRETTMYPTWAYFLAIVLDFGLRFLWTLTLLHSVSEFFAGGATPGQASSDYSPFSMYLTALLSWGEVFRRGMWACLRVEHEHLANAFGFRRVNYVPFHFDSPLDEDDSEIKKKMSTISKLGFFFEIFGFFVLVLFVIVFTVYFQLTSNFTSATMATDLDSKQ